VTVAWPLPVHSAVIVAGKVKVGGVVSWTFTVKEPVAVLPLPSAAEQLTVVVPRLKLLPEGGVQTAVTEPSQVSVAVAV
jgi:hypothetical protein